MKAKEFNDVFKKLNSIISKADAAIKKSGIQEIGNFRFVFQFNEGDCRFVCRKDPDTGKMVCRLECDD